MDWPTGCLENKAKEDREREDDADESRNRTRKELSAHRP